MGLFNRRAETKQELDALRAELQMMRGRLDESEDEKRRLAEFLGQLGGAQDRLATQIGTVEQHVGSVAGSIAPAIDSAIVKAASAADFEQLRKTVTAHQLAVASSGEAAIAAQSAVHTRLEELAAAVARQQEHLADVAIVATDTAERTDTALAEMQAGAAARRDPDAELRAQLGQLAEKVGAVDSRVNQVSTELTNQLTELSGDLDQASARADALDMVEQLATQLHDVTSGQQRLANEQARYAIQFRAELAELADRLRRPGSA